MKKAITVLMCLCVFFSCFIPASAQEQEVKGLHENLEGLWMKNNFSEEELTALDEHYTEYTSSYLTDIYIPLAFKIPKNRTSTPEEEYELLMHEAVLDYNKAVKVSLLNTKYYYKQYAENGTFGYLLDNYYWYVKKKYIWNGDQNFEANGNILSYYAWNQKYPTGYPMYLSDEALDFLRNEEKIKALILEKGKTEVSDIKIFCGLDLFPILYVNCNGNEYFMKLDENTGAKPDGQNLHSVELFGLYSAEEFWGELDKTPKLTEAATHSGQFAERARQIKTTFTKEAEALQSQGLLYGNEKGLDLLKPLTRIEAATILIRAIGIENSVTLQSEEVFSDVPESHWGYETALIAAQEGLILGNGDGTFSPDKQVSANEFATMILRCSNIDEFNWENALEILVEQGILTDTDTEDMSFFTRGDMAKIIYEARSKKLISN
ncbi:MAG: S-layer homology domain-containing protein [Clostridia bacterium]|nr:S-layer homology domain-containing protein [Clostridia bacterium]